MASKALELALQVNKEYLLHSDIYLRLGVLGEVDQPGVVPAAGPLHPVVEVVGAQTPGHQHQQRQQGGGHGTRLILSSGPPEVTRWQTCR